MIFTSYQPARHLAQARLQTREWRTTQQMNLFDHEVIQKHCQQAGRMGSHNLVHGHPAALRAARMAYEMRQIEFGQIL